MMKKSKASANIVMTIVKQLLLSKINIKLNLNVQAAVMMRVLSLETSTSTAPRRILRLSAAPLWTAMRLRRGLDLPTT